MEAESSLFQIFFSEASPSADSIQCHLSPEISADDVEIRWFKETECVCFYKNGWFIEGIGYKGRVSLCNEELKRGNVSFQLKESDDGDYLFQVTSGNRTEEKTVSKLLKTTTGTPWTEQPGKKWTEKERIEMANSALSAVFHRLEKTVAQTEKTPLQKDLQGITATTSREMEENPNQTESTVMQQEDKSAQMCENMETSPSEPEEQKITHLDNQQSDPGQTSTQSNKGREIGIPITAVQNPGQMFTQLNKNEDESQQSSEKKQRMEICKPLTIIFPEKIKVFSISDGKTNECKKQFIDTLRKQIENLMEVSTEEESDIILNFCPIVSRAGTDIDAALKNFKNSTESKLNVLVVLHHTFDPEKTVLDSSKSVNREDTLTVDLLFYEDTGLLECQKNSDAYDKVVNWLEQQGMEKGIPISLFQKKPVGSYLSSWFTSWTNPEPAGQNMQQMKSPSSHSVKYFLSVTGDAQKHHMHFINDLKKQMSLMEVSTVNDSDVIFLFCPEVTDHHRREGKPVILIFLHDTMDPGSVSNSSTFEKRQHFILVECSFDHKGLLDCQKNRDDISEFLKGEKQKRDL